MRKFAVTINGQNFFVNMEGNEGRYGFVAVRFVEAEDIGKAERLAIDKLKSDGSLKALVLNDEEDPPVLQVEEVVELDSFQEIEDLNPGLVWYSESKSWWQFWKR